MWQAIKVKFFQAFNKIDFGDRFKLEVNFSSYRNLSLIMTVRHEAIEQDGNYMYQYIYLSNFLL